MIRRSLRDSVFYATRRKPLFQINKPHFKKQTNKKTGDSNASVSSNNERIWLSEKDQVRRNPVVNKLYDFFRTLIKLQSRSQKKKGGPYVHHWICIAIKWFGPNDANI